MKSIFYCINIILLIFLTLNLQSQEYDKESRFLIKPTGAYDIGTMVYEWCDHARNLNLSNHSEDKRTIIAKIWYPSQIDSNAVIAPLNAISKDYRNVYSNSYLRPKFNDKIEKANVIIISPGRGTESYLYSTISEELASHGYVVVSVDMPEIGYTIYSDGLIIKPSPKYKPPRGLMGGPYEKVDTFFEAPTAIGFQDLKLLHKQLRELNSNDPNNRFTNKLNLDEIGIFGHSLGGRIAGKFAAEIPEVKGYISMEGIPPRNIRYEGLLSIPIAMMCSSSTWPYAKENYYSLIENRNRSVYMIELPVFGHNSVTDNPYLYPESYNYEIDPSKGLIISRKIVLNYFNAFIRKSVSFKDQLNNIPGVLLTVHD